MTSRTTMYNASSKQAGKQPDQPIPTITGAYNDTASTDPLQDDKYDLYEEMSSAPPHPPSDTAMFPETKAPQNKEKENPRDTKFKGESQDYSFPKDLFVAKQFYKGFTFRLATEHHIDGYFQFRSAAYLKAGVTDASLQEVVACDFESIRRSWIKSADKLTLCDFRRVLRCYGVYVDLSMSIEDALMEVFLRKRHHDWTKEQLLEYQTDETQPFVSAKWANLPVGLGTKPQAEPPANPPVRPLDGGPAGHLTLPKSGKVIGSPTTPFDVRGEPPSSHGSRDVRVPHVALPGSSKDPLVDAPAGSPGDGDDDSDGSDDGNDWGGGRGGDGGRGGNGGRGGRNHNHSDHPNHKNDQSNDQRNQSRCLVDLSKIYRVDDRYKGIDDSFDLKISIFGEHCRRVFVPSEMTTTAFPIMLSGAARDYYQANLSNLPDTYQGLCEMMVNNFEGPEHQRNMLLKWNNVSFKAYIENNPGTDLQEVFNTMIKDLRFLQHTIPPTMRDPQSYYIKILSACDGVPECHSAICNPRSSVSDLINQIKQTIDSYRKAFPRQGTPAEAFLTDRRFYNN